MSEQNKRLKKQDLEKNLKNHNVELGLVKSAKEEQIKKRDLLARLIEVRKQMHPIAMKNYVYANPTYKFQADPDYIALQKEMAEVEFEMEVMTKTGQLNEANKRLESYDEQIESLAKSIPELEVKIKEIGE